MNKQRLLPNLVLRTVIFLFFLDSFFFCSLAQSSFQEKLKKLANFYEIEIIYQDLQPYLDNSGYSKMKAVLASTEGLEKYTPVFLEEFQRYPKALIKKIKLRSVILCHQLYYGEQTRSGIPAFSSSSLWLDIEKYPWNYLIHTLHHEMYHFIDQMDDGEIRIDRGWELLNRKGFRYGKGGHLMRGSTTALIRHDLEGFLNEYSTSGVEEDKAEIYTHFLLNTDPFEKFARRDPLLRKKLQLLKKQLHRFCNELDDIFWEQQQKKPPISSFWKEFNPLTFEEAKQQRHDPYWAIRRGAVYSLGQNENEEVVPLLIEALEDPNDYVCLEAIEALLHQKKQARAAIPKLKKLSSHSKHFVRETAIESLAQIQKATQEE